MRKRFYATRGSRSLVFWANDLADAYDYFERRLMPRTERAFEYEIREQSNLPDPILNFLQDAGRGESDNQGDKQTMSKKDVPDEVRKYMSELGKKGGKSNPAGTEKRKQQAKEAAERRWEKYRDEQQKRAGEEEEK